MFLLNPRGRIGWGASGVSLALSPFRLLCFQARMGPSAPFPSLHLSGLNNPSENFPVLKLVHPHIPLCHLSLPSLSCSAIVKSERGFQHAGSCPDAMERPGGTSRSNLGLLGSFMSGWRWFLLEGLGSMVGAHRMLSSTWLGGTCEDVCAWEIMKKKSNTVSHKKLSLLLMGGRQDWCYGSC